MNQLTINTGEEKHTFDIKASGEVLIKEEGKCTNQEENATVIKCNCGNRDTIDEFDSYDNTSNFVVLVQTNETVEYLCLECEEELTIEKEN